MRYTPRQSATSDSNGTQACTTVAHDTIQLYFQNRFPSSHVKRICDTSSLYTSTMFGAPCGPIVRLSFGRQWAILTPTEKSRDVPPAKGAMLDCRCTNSLCCDAHQCTASSWDPSRKQSKSRPTSLDDNAAAWTYRLMQKHCNNYHLDTTIIMPLNVAYRTRCKSQTGCTVESNT